MKMDKAHGFEWREKYPGSEKAMYCRCNCIIRDMLEEKGTRTDIDAFLDEMDELHRSVTTIRGGSNAFSKALQVRRKSRFENAIC